MPRVVPSQVVSLIDQLFPVATREKVWNLNPDHQNHVAAIIDIVDQIPPELLTLKADDYAGFLASMAAIRHTVLRWGRAHPEQLKKTPGFGINPVTLIRQALATCRLLALESTLSARYDLWYLLSPQTILARRNKDFSGGLFLC